MSFGGNVVYYRRKLGITQEELAEMLHVSRQTVSRWETDLTFPDIDTLIVLCDKFGCTMDTLVRGDAEAEEGNDVAEDATPTSDIPYTVRKKQFFTFALTCAAGVALVLLGVAAMLFTYSVSEILSVVLLMSFITLAVTAFIIGGITHSSFLKAHPVLPEYPKEEARKFLSKSPFLFAAATALVLIGVIVLILIVMLGEQTDAVAITASGILITFVAASASLFTYTGIIYSDRSDKEKEGEGDLSPKGKRINDAISSAIMLLATAAFLLMGFLGGLWHPGWVVFPIGGVLSGIVSSTLSAIYPNK